MKQPMMHRHTFHSINYMICMWIDLHRNYKNFLFYSKQMNWAWNWLIYYVRTHTQNSHKSIFMRLFYFHFSHILWFDCNQRHFSLFVCQCTYWDGWQLTTTTNKLHSITSNLYAFENSKLKWVYEHQFMWFWLSWWNFLWFWSPRGAFDMYLIES